MLKINQKFKQVFIESTEMNHFFIDRSIQISLPGKTASSNDKTSLICKTSLIRMI